MTFIKLFLLTILSIHLSACITNPVTYKDMILPDQIKPGYTVPEEISKEDWALDEKILLLNLKKGYAGRFNLKPHILRQAHKSIKKIKAPIKTQNLCEKISSIFSKIPDNHLRVYRQGKSCKKTKKEYNLIGKSLAQTRDKTWVVETHKKKGKKVLYIAIKGFPNHKNSVWNSFFEKIKKLHKKSDLIVLDMRDNGGGDDTTGYKLSAFLHQIKDHSKIPTPYGKQITSQTPETQTLKINSANVGIRFKRSPENLLLEWRKESEETLKKVLNKEEKEVKITLDETLPKAWRFSGYKTPVYILMDSGCGSSCESSIDAFEFNPHVKKVGINTSGTLHFGNIAGVYLKNSLLYIQTPTHANFYTDGRFIETVGIAPDIKVPLGTDAYTFLVENIL